MVEDMASVLMYGDTVRSPELRHEVPHSVTDAFLYVEHDGARYAVLRSLEVARMREVPGMNPLPLEDFGLDELTEQGLDGEAAHLEIVARACRKLGVADAKVPPGFPLGSPTGCAPTASTCTSTASCSRAGAAPRPPTSWRASAARCGPRRPGLTSWATGCGPPSRATASCPSTESRSPASASSLRCSRRSSSTARTPTS